MATISSNNNSGSVEKVNSAFKNRVVILTYKNMKKENLVPETFLKEASGLLREEVNNYLKSYNSLKFNIELHGAYVKPKVRDLEDTIMEVKTFQTKMKEILDIDEFDMIFMEKTEQVLNKMEEFQERDSGWTLIEIIKVDLNLNKYQPLKGSTYLPLPKRLMLKRACVNVRNNDIFCFKWSIIAAIANVKKNGDLPYSYKVDIFQNTINMNGFSINFNGLSFPLKIKDISIFEANNPEISVNVFGYDAEKDLVVGPYYKRKAAKSKHINLMFLQDDKGDNAHYVWIKNISRLIGSQITKKSHKIYVCDDCIQHFYKKENLDKHIKHCSRKIAYTPDTDKSILEFKNFNNSLEVPFVIYADSECIFENIQTCIPKGDCSSTTLVDKHVPYAFSYFIKWSFQYDINTNQSNRFKELENFKKVKTFKGLDSPKLFIENLVRDVKYLYKNFTAKTIPMTPLTEEENLDFFNEK